MKPVRRAHIWLAVATALALVALGAWLLLRRSPSAEQVAIEVRDCVLAGDSACVADRMQDGELERLGMTRDDLDRFLKGWVHQRFHGRLLPEDRDVVGDGKSSGWQGFSWMIQTDRGQARPLTVDIAKTDDGLKAVNLVSGLILTDAAFDENGMPGKGIDKLRMFVKNIEEQRAVLESQGVRRVITGPSGRDVMTWDEFLTWTKQRIAARS